MGIDRIGKGGAPPIDPSGAAGGVEKAGSVEKTFSVGGSEQAHASADVSGMDATAPLARLRAGEIDVNGYVDLKVEEATKGLEGLPASDLADIKQLLRDQMATDPGLVELVTKATGSPPTPPED